MKKYIKGEIDVRNQTIDSASMETRMLPVLQENIGIKRPRIYTKISKFIEFSNIVYYDII